MKISQDKDGKYVLGRTNMIKHKETTVLEQEEVNAGFAKATAEEKADAKNSLENTLGQITSFLSSLLSYDLKTAAASGPFVRPSAEEAMRFLRDRSYCIVEVFDGVSWTKHREMSERYGLANPRTELRPDVIVNMSPLSFCAAWHLSKSHVVSTVSVNFFFLSTVIFFCPCFSSCFYSCFCSCCCFCSCFCFGFCFCVCLFLFLLLFLFLFLFLFCVCFCSVSLLSSRQLQRRRVSRLSGLRRRKQCGPYGSGVSEE